MAGTLKRILATLNIFGKTIAREEDWERERRHQMGKIYPFITFRP